ncbi:bifunctional methionine sulfoxide reductase B/A protein [Candidatus Falkowbacteria bacterium]|nr:bifunctional methionine sulfoxide reductase B/A protein [Candidatus Falkowbacteria bacterium]
MQRLTPEEKRVIVDHGTEAPFSGQYDDFYRDGLYVCRNCGAALYDSGSKFDAHCGWPAFDDEIPGSVKRTLDTDGQCTEISCSSCGAHLGHVFSGERMTAKDARHCVNSLSMFFIPRKFEEHEERFAVFGGGCFWCTEAIFKSLKGVSWVISGYAGGETANPTYEQVSDGGSGHAETVKVAFEPNEISYGDLLDVFFATHDPTTKDRQGHDAGTQYRSIILYKTLEHRDEALAKIKELDASGIYSDKIVTEVVPLYRFYAAEDYHQDYFAKNKDQNPYCQAVINPKLLKLREKYSALTKK